MSISNKLTYLNETKQKIKESINLTNANITNEPFRQYAVILKNRLPEIVGDPTIIWNNYEHVTGSGTSITISTYKSIFEYSLNGNTTQSGTPTPDAPIPVNTVTGNQTITISDGTNSTVQYINLGKNLFDNKIVQAQNSATLEITSTGFNITRIHNANYGDEFIASYTIENLSPNTIYTFNLDVESENTFANGSLYVYSDRLFGTSLTKSNYTENNNNRKWNITTNSTGKMILGFYGTTTTQNKIFKFTNIQLEKNPTVTSYVPYFEPIELCKIGNYKDRIYKSNGKWYIHKEIGKKIIDSVSYAGENGSGETSYQASTNDISEMPSLNWGAGLCSHFKNGNGTKQDNSFRIGANSKQIYIYTNNTNFSNLTNANNWLSNNNLMFYIPLATPITEEIKNYNLLNDLNSLELMTGSITITVSGDLPSPIDITAIKN